MPKKQQLQICPKSPFSLPKIFAFSAQNQTQIANPKSSSIIKPKLQKKKKKKERHVKRGKKKKKGERVLGGSRCEIIKKSEEKYYLNKRVCIIDKLI